MPVSLQQFIDTMDVLSDEHHAYLHKGTFELATLSNEEMSAIEEGDDWAAYPEWQQEQLQTAKRVMESDQFLELPDKDEINEYGIIETFCEDLPNRLQNEFFSCIHGSGAFRRFKDALHRHGIADHWYRFRYQILKDIAIEWCEDNEIQYIDDTSRRKM